MHAIELPSYKEQSPKVAERFARLKQREVIMEAEGISRIFSSEKEEITALSDVSFKAYRREFLSVIGPSGCGKSTLIRILSGLDQATSGQVLLDGKPVAEPGPERGMVFQGYTLFPWLSVKKNVMFGLEVAGLSRATAESEAMQWIDMVGLADFASHYPAQLSGGMKQRVAIARALANQPRVLLMDEPFGALDAQTRAKMQSYLMQIWRNVDITIIFITHDLDEAVYLSDRILVLDAHPGRVREMVEVPVEQPRSPAQHLNPEFLATKNHIEELIHPPSEEEENLPMIRMTTVQDEIF
ncbi:ABC transporter ATP-binding protein [Desulfobulbus rhabdoformis]|uniref:ABC transporter ATP-binding protein n=1 Tax=Desulfobulbus rhabdoformis TaxID=34032 RepID=UPI0019661FAB|nr:ABC transporter ATP-binding protein [Desulfobulbus rhabdoformis]MBM9615605.1 ABC transporter ATP-binding protein [Desulfobulbus rhabdoformis]